MRVRRVLAGSAPTLTHRRVPLAASVLRCLLVGARSSLLSPVCLFVCLFVLFACLRLYLFVCFLLLVTAARAWCGSGARESRVRSSEFSVALSIDRFRCRCGRKTSPSPGEDVACNAPSSGADVAGR